VTAAAGGLVLAGPERLASGATWSEGPVWLPATGRVRWSDIPGDRILEWEEGLTEPLVYREGVEFTNGRTLDLDGSVLQCSHGRRAVERDRDGEVTTLVDRWRGVRLNSPNDLVVASDGSVLFTDPPYGIVIAREGHPGEREYGDHYVFRFVPATGELTPIVVDVEEPNGLALSPDERTLYVADTAEVLRMEGDERGTIRAYDVRAGFRCKNGRLFARTGGVADGLRVDVEGRIWTSAGTGVEVYDPSGALLERVELPELVANLCFGGPDGTDVYVAASTSLYRLRTRTRDAADHAGRAA
jgi:gluconolactonase